MVRLRQRAIPLRRNSHGLLQVCHGVLAAAGGMQQVSEVVVQGGFPMPVALHGAQRQGCLDEPDCPCNIAAAPLKERQIVECRHFGDGIVQTLGRAEALLKMRARLVKFTAAAGEDAETVVRLGERPRIAGRLCFGERLARQFDCSRGQPTTMSNQAPVGIEPRGVRGAALIAVERCVGGLEVALRQVPFASAAGQICQLVLDRS
ncbi:MAG TPA: hypothetical protein VGL99_17245 [Chloroflexota bacterium]